MPNFLKYVLYFIGGYALILGLLSLITSNSKCNILSSGSCGAFDAIYIVMLTPLVIPSVMLENNKEEKQLTKFQEEVRKGVELGKKEDLESCIYHCYFIMPKEDPDRKKTENYEFISAQKLIKFDDRKAPPQEQDKQAYMILAYWKLSQVEEFGSKKYQQFINRAWQLIVEYNQNNDYKLGNYDYVINGVGGSAFLLKHELFAKEVIDKSVQNAFDGCMFDPFWKQAKYSSQDADTEILHSCMDALNEYVYEKKIDKNFEKKFEEKWHAQWEEELKARHP